MKRNAAIALAVFEVAAHLFLLYYILQSKES
jgi:hypothetical protein